MASEWEGRTTLGHTWVCAHASVHSISDSEVLIAEKKKSQRSI